MNTLAWAQLKIKLREALLVLPNFLKNPIKGICEIPDWDWPTTLVLQAAFAATCGLLGNLVDRNFLGAIVGIILAPIMTVLLVGMGAGIFYYAFLFFFEREISFKQIYLNLIFAVIPIHIAAIAMNIFPPMLLIGVAASSVLLHIGMENNFAVDKKKLKVLIGSLFSIFLVYFALQMFRATTQHARLKQRATPESLDILEKEFLGD